MIKMTIVITIFVVIIRDCFHNSPKTGFWVKLSELLLLANCFGWLPKSKSLIPAASVADDDEDDG